ncbi:MAG: 8-oxoguanine DNA glycosylase, partial [Eubacterium sp.]|nr:8-oxoguanine DNA glycosylase [Candidatus Colimonas fimequi]
TPVAYGRPATISYDKDAKILTIVGASPEDFQNVWRNYLDLDRDYGAIKTALAADDPVMARAIEFGSGIRILNQEKWETLVSFIISQNNNIPRIKKCIESLARTLGEEVGEFGGRTWYKLPSPERLAAATEEDLAPCKLGYRAKYLIATGRKVAEEGVDSLDKLAVPYMTAGETVDALREYTGVGPKVANCISLFAMGQIDSFPIDVWVKRVMHQLYGIEEGDMKAMARYAKDHFGALGGIAQQYLFYYITHCEDLV